MVGRQMKNVLQCLVFSMVMGLSFIQAPTLRDFGICIEHAPPVEVVEEKLPAPTQKIVAYIQDTNPKVPPKKATKIAKVVKKVAAKYKMKPEILVGLMHVESTFDPKAVSEKGAIGLMQINPRVWLKPHDDGNDLITAGIVNSRDQLFDMEKNIEAGAHILNVYYEQGKAKKVANPMRYAVNKYNGQVGHYKKTMTSVKQFKDYKVASNG